MVDMSTHALTEAFVKAKTDEIAASVAKSTGVDRAHVVKVLDHLGVGSALANRLKVDLGKLRVGVSGISI